MSIIVSCPVKLGAAIGACKLRADLIEMLSGIVRSLVLSPFPSPVNVFVWSLVFTFTFKADTILIVPITRSPVIVRLSFTVFQFSASAQI